MSVYFLAAMLVLAAFAGALRDFGAAVLAAGFFAALFAMVASPQSITDVASGIEGALPHLKTLG
jgi:hypothetical protein